MLTLASRSFLLNTKRLGTPLLGAPITRSLAHGRFFSVAHPETRCKRCDAVLPKDLVAMFERKELGSLSLSVKCAFYPESNFLERSDCGLSQALKRIVALFLKRPHVLCAYRPIPLLECLHPVPEEDLGDLRGDHGKQLAKYLQFCFENRQDKQGKPLVNFGSIIDIGGQSTATVEKIGEVFNIKFPSLIVDLNSLTPFIAPADSRIKFVAAGAIPFFSSKECEGVLDEATVGAAPRLFVCNNLLTVMSPADGWDTLRAIDEKMRGGDYLVISGLFRAQLASGYEPGIEIDGILEFLHKGDKKVFYKSAFTKEFPGCVGKKLKQCSVLHSEIFDFFIKMKSESKLEVKGSRLFVVKGP